MMASELASKQCVPCRGGVPPLDREQVGIFLERLGGEWATVDNHHLTKEYAFPDFKQALWFTNTVGAIAEDQGHHPDIFLSWGRVQIDIWTHKIDGLTESDFVLAAKVDEALEASES
jgi:4a-hydroxytetrahydrobiopterin dehydratase